MPTNAAPAARAGWRAHGWGAVIAGSPRVNARGPPTRRAAPAESSGFGKWAPHRAPGSRAARFIAVH
ncbi:hypothetical protein FFM54_35750 [Burkholderia pseudomallei]|nr:hypothetical protein FFM54_35750 [Burkholderia pseudomallei]